MNKKSFSIQFFSHFHFEFENLMRIFKSFELQIFNFLTMYWVQSSIKATPHISSTRNVSVFKFKERILFAQQFDQKSIGGGKCFSMTLSYVMWVLYKLSTLLRRKGSLRGDFISCFTWNSRLMSAQKLFLSPKFICLPKKNIRQLVENVAMYFWLSMYIATISCVHKLLFDGTINHNMKCT